MELINASTSGSAQGKWYSWRASTENGGTPGAAGSGSVGVVINEVLAHTDPPVNLTDSIELHNTSSVAIDIGGWFLSDDDNNLFRYEIPANSVIPAGGDLVLDESDFNAGNDAEGFALSGTGGDQVYLVRGTKQQDADQGGTVSHFVDHVSFRETLNGETLGRVPNGMGRLAPLSRATLGGVNVDPRVGPLLISEIMFNPVPSAAALAADPDLEASDLEFVEIHNPTATPITLTDWRIRGGVDFNFDDGQTIASGGSLVILKFNPQDPENINQVNAFKAHYGIGDEVTLLGGYGGQLGNSDDRVLLLRPDPTADADGTPRVQEDEVLYDDLAPWPIQADQGFSLQRANLAGFGNDAASWIAANGSPGSLLTSLPGDLDGNGTVDAEDINAMFTQMRSANPDLANFDLTGDGAVDAGDRDFLIENLIGIPYGDSNFDGRFTTSDLVATFTVGEYEDGVALNSTWQDGDWNGDGDFTTADFVLALGRGGFEAAAAVAADVELEVLENRHLLRAALVDEGSVGEQKGSTVQTPVSVEESGRLRTLESIDSSLSSLFVDNDVDLVDDAADDLADALADDGLDG